jgi:hypothetical protein
LPERTKEEPADKILKGSGQSHPRDGGAPDPRVRDGEGGESPQSRPASSRPRCFGEAEREKRSGGLGPRDPVEDLKLLFLRKTEELREELLRGSPKTSQKRLTRRTDPPRGGGGGSKREKGRTTDRRCLPL